MKADLVRKYLGKSPQTSKGHLKRPRVGIRSTRLKKTCQPSDISPNDNKILPNALQCIPETMPVIILAETHEMSNIFCFAALAYKRNGTPSN